MSIKTFAESAAGLAHAAENHGQQAIIFALLAINDSVREVRNAIEADRNQCTDPDRREGHCCGIEEWQTDPTHDDWFEFMRQNPSAGRVTPEVMVNLMPYVSHHAGGLYVVQRDLTVDGRDLQVKLHDTWGDIGENGERVLLHVYDPDDPTGDVQRMFQSGMVAAQLFFDDVHLTAWWGHDNPWTGAKTAQQIVDEGMRKR